MVVGLGVTGLSVVSFLDNLPRELCIRVIDTRDNPPGKEQLADHIQLHSGGWQSDWLAQADLIVLSPGIALATPEIQQAISQGCRVVGDIELFAWYVDKPVIAITGSNGKSTVTDLTGVMAKACGIHVGVGGNIGVPALDLLGHDHELYVLELSSFQLETTNSLATIASVFLNLSEDHMDRYESMEEYRQAKLKIFDHAQFSIVNHADRATYPDGVSENQLITFGLDENSQYGLSSYKNEEYLTSNGDRVLATKDLSLVGRHNVANALVAIALLDSAKIDYVAGLEALKSYTGLTHRCQVVVDNNNIKWINDSKATNVASTLAALSGLSCQGKLYLLLGGEGKGADFTDLKEPLSAINVELCCFGKDAAQFLSLHHSAKQYDTMHDVIESIAPLLQPHDMVMLSPACASFDQYKNFMARGEAFTELAHQYAD
nr:UDP-N-acetylmuramoyl-L-alanine--D-glutamate ligase [Vibrio sinus]